MIYNKKIIEGTVFLDEQDSGLAMIADVRSDGDEENGIWVKIVSWDTEKKHEEFNKMCPINARLRITIETI